MTSTTTSTSVVLVTTTTTVTATPDPTTTFISLVAPTGLRYYDYFPKTYRSGSSLYSNLAAVVDGVRNNDGYNISGSIREINGLTTSNNQIAFPGGQSGPSNSFASVFQGYIYPALGAGTYTITSRNQVIDDIGIVWIGEKAIGSNWTYTNRDYGANWPSGSPPFPASGSVSFTLTENQSKAITIFWGNVDGPGQADFVVQFGGASYTNTSRFFVGPCNNDVFRP